jgi:hypothetical protein
MISVGLASSQDMIPFGWIFWQTTPKNHSIVWLEVVTSFIATSDYFLNTLLCVSQQNGRLMREPEMQEWVSMSKPEDKKAYPLSEELKFAIDRFFFNHYCQAFRTGAFARANCSM